MACRNLEKANEAKSQVSNSSLYIMFSDSCLITSFRFPIISYVFFSDFSAFLQCYGKQKNLRHYFVSLKDL